MGSGGQTGIFNKNVVQKCDNYGGQVKVLINKQSLNKKLVLQEKYDKTIQSKYKTLQLKIAMKGIHVGSRKISATKLMKKEI